MDSLLTTAGQRLGVPAVFHDEVRDVERRVRPDYGVSVDGAVFGYVEVKAPGKPVDPEAFTGHDRTQWERQRDLPNLVYTNGTHWRLFRDGEAYLGPVVLGGGDLAHAGRELRAVPEFEALLTDFLRWKPAPITSVRVLVRSVAPLTRLLRGEVLDQLAAEQRAVDAGADSEAQPFTGLARDWRALLFPQADDATFADGYAQTVAFALLLARTEGIELANTSLHQIGVALGAGHSLMGKALQLLTDDVATDFKVTLDLMVRVVGAVNWPRVRRTGRDTYLHLYEDFLELYDPGLRKKSGSYYTPRPVVEEMVRLVEEALVTRLGKPAGFRDPGVLTIDPAMGTGTYLHAILDRVADQAERQDGPGTIPGVLSQVAERLVGFEVQMGPYAVAELRTTDLLNAHGAKPPKDGMGLFVTDTLDDPYSARAQISSALRLISQSRRKANDIKAKADVQVVLGNPPYKELAAGGGSWVEHGGEGHPAILNDFLRDVPGKFSAKVKNLYVYFWRWATWKVWESTPLTARRPNGDSGVVCFISTSGYLTGPAFTAMREYLRRNATDGWIIDLTPEGQTPDIPTRPFPGVRQPLAIGLFLRTPGASHEMPATIRYRALHGRREEKFGALAQLRLDGDGWREVRSGWTDPLTPAADGGWDTYPAVADLLPWYSPGVFPLRTWIYAPSPDTLRERWTTLLAERDPAVQARLFKEGHDGALTKPKSPLPGSDTHQTTLTLLRDDRVTEPQPIRVGYRAFDRQWILPDSRLMDRPRLDLWAARVPGQIFVVEQHMQRVKDGPGLVFSALLPDYHHFKGSEGGRVLPFLHPDGTANLAPGLTAALTAAYGQSVRADEVLAYLAGAIAHPGYTSTFVDQLTTPGIRVPVTADPALWTRAVGLGRQVLKLHTYGAAAPPGQPASSIRYPHGDARQPRSIKAITTMPENLRHDDTFDVLVIGDGEIGPVSAAAAAYAVGGKNVLKSWFNYRKKDPGGKRTSQLDHLHPTTWNPDWTTELIELLTILTQLTELEPTQATLLDEIRTGPLLSLKALAAAGTQWPTDAKADRRPSHSRAAPSILGE